MGEPVETGLPAPRRKLLVIGLDGVPPELLFDRLLPVMPRIRALLQGALRAPMRTTDPPISVPAWPVMFTGVDPGTLGLYGFRHRRRTSYTEMHLPTSEDLRFPTVWEILSERGRRVGVIGMPLGFPPPKVNGLYISDFLTPSGSEVTTHPASLAHELEERFGPYVFDVKFRSDELDRVRREILEMTRHRFEVAAYLYARESWDVFAVHEIGTDRLHHAFWKHFDTAHPEFVAGGPYERIAEEYYALLDRGIGELLDATDAETDVVIVSDHGSMAMRGCFCVNQWLEENGYLVLNHPPKAPGTPFEQLDVDWARTTVWGAGGYYARLFFNVRGREPLGALHLDEVEPLRERLAQQLHALRTPEGEPMRVEILDPHHLYAEVRGEAPDLMVYFDELRIRSAGTMGHPTTFLRENDSGPDDAVHGPYGVFVYRPAGASSEQRLAPFPLINVAPTLLELLGEPVPTYVQGRAVPEVVEAARGRRLVPAEA
jgi:predicted AlkP superfamily phosphohydrolase/phosphomutase